MSEVYHPIESRLDSIESTLDCIHDVLCQILAVLEKQPTCNDEPEANDR